MITASTPHRTERRSLSLRRIRARHALTGVGFLLPFYVAFGLFLVFPMGYALYESLFQIKHTGGIFSGHPVSAFAWFDQYKAVFTNASFQHGVLRVAIYTAVYVPSLAFVAVSLALLLDATRPRLAGVFRTTYFLPFAVPTVIAAIMWGSMYTPAVSPLKDVHLYINFLAPNLLIPSIANIGLWASTGFYVILVTTALTAIPGELFEAAKMDGASEWRIALSIKLPLIRPTIIMSMLLAIIWTMQLFTEPTVLRTLSSTVDSNFTPTMMAYDQLVTGDFNFAAAISMTLAIVGLALSFGFLLATRRRGERVRRAAGATA